MAKEIKLPKFGQDTQEGTILKCLVKIGDNVKKGDIIFEIETDKVTLEMESPEAGFVKAIIAQDNQTVDVGSTLMVLGGENEKINAADFSAPAKKTTSACGCLGQPVLDGVAEMSPEKMLFSKQNIPCFYLSIAADITELVEQQNELNKTSPVKISLDDFLIRALSLGFEKWPIMTGTFAGDCVHLADSPGIGITVGRVAPVIKDVCKKNLAQIAADRIAVIKRAEAGKLADGDLKNGCMTVSNLGELGIDSFIPIVIPGQCSVLGVGKITDTCVSQDEGFVTRKVVKMTLAVDHKTANGAEAAQFFSLVAKLLEDPKKLVL
jgi:pyruvate dehydrogenase E2 component (dihydrolipoamide acetyltransferase)